MPFITMISLSTWLWDLYGRGLLGGRGGRCVEDAAVTPGSWYAYEQPRHFSGCVARVKGGKSEMTSKAVPDL